MKIAYFFALFAGVHTILANEDVNKAELSNTNNDSSDINQNELTNNEDMTINNDQVNDNSKTKESVLEAVNDYNPNYHDNSYGHPQYNDNHGSNYDGNHGEYDESHNYQSNKDYGYHPQNYKGEPPSFTNHAANYETSYYPYNKYDKTSHYPIYDSYTDHFKQAPDVPFPYTFIKDRKTRDLHIPKLGDYHCFLTGAPWTTCGRKSLTSYFLDQCLVFYFQLSSNVDGICGGVSFLKDHDDRHGGYKPYSSGHDDHDGYEITPDYYREKCLQSSYVSITTATVMCLTENYIRINFIEHYASNACNNPVEGPILYLRKLHGFIQEVLDCTGDEAARNYPNLYRTFRQSDTVKYNPNAPYYLNSDKKVSMEHYTSGEASGLNAYTLGDQFMCADPNDLWRVPIIRRRNHQWFVYLSIPSTTHYSASDLTKNPGDPGFDWTNNQYSVCTTSSANAELGNKVYRYCKTSQYTVDRTYRGLYDAVHFIEREASSLRRPQSIAEVAVRSAGWHEQPILEGFGIMYYCAFYACRANNEGDLSRCYPGFESEKDWNLAGALTYKKLKWNSDEVLDCIDHGFLVAEDINQCDKVQDYNRLLNQRSYLCLAENEIVNFLECIYPHWEDEEDAISLVYGRHLADEKCHGERPVSSNGGPLHKGCPSYSEVYDGLKDALAQLIATCNDNKAHRYGKYDDYYTYATPYPDQAYYQSTTTTTTTTITPPAVAESFIENEIGDRDFKDNENDQDPSEDSSDDANEE